MVDFVDVGHLGNDGVFEKNKRVHDYLSENRERNVEKLAIFDSAC
jgi:hypothetical protein